MLLTHDFALASGSKKEKKGVQQFLFLFLSRIGFLAFTTMLAQTHHGTKLARFFSLSLSRSRSVCVSLSFLRFCSFFWRDSPTELNEQQSSDARMKLRLTLPFNVDTNNEQDDQFEQHRGEEGEEEEEGKGKKADDNG